MSENVQFDGDNQGMPSRPQNTGRFASPAGFGQSQLPGMAGWLLKRGIVKTETAAKNVLIGVVIVDFLAAAVIIYFFVR